MPNILALVYDYSLGGAQKLTLSACEGLTNHGHNVTVMPVCDSDDFLIDIADPRINLKNDDSEQTWDNLVERLLAHLEEHPTDIIYGSDNRINTILCLLKAQGTLPEHTSLIVWPTVPLDFWQDKYEKGVIEELTAQMVYKEADLIIAQCQELAERIVNFTHSSDNITVIHNPTLSIHYHGDSTEEINHPWLREGRNHKTVIAVGRLAYEKGFDDLISAFRLLHEKNNDTKLIILGEGTEREILQEKIDRFGLNDCIELHGRVKNTAPFYEAADLFVLSSRSEGSPGALIEAMSHGLDFVATNCPTGPVDISEHGRFGRIVPVGDIEAMANAVEDALENPITPLAKLEQQKHVNNEYNLANFSNRLQTIIEEKAL